MYLYTPDHWCKISAEIQSKLNITDQNKLYEILIPKEDDGTKSKCYMYDVENLEELKQEQIRRHKCTYGYEYNYTGYFKSATSQFDWVCDEEWKATFTQSMFFGGAIIGQFHIS